MSVLVVDANVFVANLRPSEPHHNEAVKFLAYVKKVGLTVAAPMIAPAEIAGAVARGTGRAALGRRAAMLLIQDPAVQLIPLDGTLGEAAANLAADYQLRGCDAIYLALAQELAVPLITLDAELSRRKPDDLIVTDPASYTHE